MRGRENPVARRIRAENTRKTGETTKRRDLNHGGGSGPAPHGTTDGGKSCGIPASYPHNWKQMLKGPLRIGSGAAETKKSPWGNHGLSRVTRPIKGGRGRWPWERAGAGGSPRPQKRIRFS